MSLIVSEVYDALVAAGAPDDKARAAAGAIPMADTLATRQDLAEFKAATRQDLAEFRQEMVEFKAELRQEMAEFKAAIRQEMAELRAELKDDINALKRDVALLKLAMFTFGPAILALLAKLVFFP